jgi:hypothetical protein
MCSCGYDWNAACHGLEDGQSEALLGRRLEEDGRTLVQGFEFGLGDIRTHLDARPETVVEDQIRYPRWERASPSEHEWRRRFANPY